MAISTVHSPGAKAKRRCAAPPQAQGPCLPSSLQKRRWSNASAKQARPLGGPAAGLSPPSSPECCLPSSAAANDPRTDPILRPVPATAPRSPRADRRAARQQQRHRCWKHRRRRRRERCRRRCRRPGRGRARAWRCRSRMVRRRPLKSEPPRPTAAAPGPLRQVESVAACAARRRARRRRCPPLSNARASAVQRAQCPGWRRGGRRQASSAPCALCPGQRRGCPSVARRLWAAWFSQRPKRRRGGRPVARHASAELRSWCDGRPRRHAARQACAAQNARLGWCRVCRRPLPTTAAKGLPPATMHCPFFVHHP
mmetsp:Transcript_164521/g.527701  ORF Transcript_164521/g.527701 Transcript_164521/m.527701 type:complete len:312 (+) Transcript_164521:90-1025(+)